MVKEYLLSSFIKVIIKYEIGFSDMFDYFFQKYQVIIGTKVDPIFLFRNQIIFESPGFEASRPNQIN